MQVLLLDAHCNIRWCYFHNVIFWCLNIFYHELNFMPLYSFEHIFIPNISKLALFKQSSQHFECVCLWVFLTGYWQQPFAEQGSHCIANSKKLVPSNNSLNHEYTEHHLLHLPRSLQAAVCKHKQATKRHSWLVVRKGHLVSCDHVLQCGNEYIIWEWGGAAVIIIVLRGYARKTMLISFNWH